MTVAEAIIASVGNTGSDLRRAVRSAASIAKESGTQAEVLGLLSGRSDLPARWLGAALTEAIEGLEASVPCWERVVTPEGCEMADALLPRARAAFRANDTSRAAGLLRLAFRCGPDYDFFLRAEALVRKCRAAFECKRKTRIALLAPSTTTFLRGAIETLCLRDGLEPEFYEPPFGTYMGEVMSPDSGFYRFNPDFVIVLLSWRDLHLTNVNDSGQVEEATGRIHELWRLVIEGTRAQILQLSFTPPPEDAWLALSSSRDSGRGRSIARVNTLLQENTPSRVVLIDAADIAAHSTGPWEDMSAWSTAKIYPNSQRLPVLAENFVSCMRAEFGLSRKLLVLDLDNTLWGGIIGEDGIGGIHLGPPSASGERYQDLHRYLKSMAERGVLLAVVSKNNPAEAMDVFERHEGSVLRLNDFVAFRANWDDKPSNIRQLAMDLRLGLDSFVFLDDNPAERAAVRRELPEVIVPEISGEPSASIDALERGMYFQATRLSNEDVTRTGSYAALATEAALRQTGAGLGDYLRDLAMQIECGPVDAETSQRVAQLINKTNQFNLTTRRYSQEEVDSRRQSSASWFRWYRLRDRFAEHGLIGVLLVDKAPSEWTVDTWLMSCRVIGRGVEEFMLRDLAESARHAGVERLRARYIPTAKNKLVEDLLPRLGFVLLNENEYVLNLESTNLPDCPFLNCVSAAVV